MVAKNPVYDRLKLRVWSFIKKFDGRRGFSLGDARAYLSALADIIIVETGTDYLTALAEALGHAKKTYSSEGYNGIVEDFRRVYKRWLEIDRGKLATDKCFSMLPRLKQEKDYVEEELTVVSLFTGAYGLDLGFDIFAHPGLWFLFGCLFVILVVFLIEYLGRKKDRED